MKIHYHTKLFETCHDRNGSTYPLILGLSAVASCSGDFGYFVTSLVLHSIVFSKCVYGKNGLLCMHSRVYCIYLKQHANRLRYMKYLHFRFKTLRET